MRREHLWARYEQQAARFWTQEEGGYPSRLSVQPGDLIEFHVSNSRHSFDIDIYHEGASRKWMTRLGPIQGTLRSVTEEQAVDGCDWPAATGLEIPSSWPSGVYTAQFSTGQGPREMLFVIRPVEPRSKALVTIAANTYAAYNNVGGKSMYDHLSTARERGPGVSFRRPLTESLGNYHLWDHFFIRWFGETGYDFDYCINSDIDRNPRLLADYACNIRIGHDEYNSQIEVDAVSDFVQSGGNLVVMSGNAFWWKVAPYPDLSGYWCAKRTSLDGMDTDMWNEIDDTRQKLLGVTYTSMIHQKTADPAIFRADTSGDQFGYFWVEDPDHWLFAGTGTERGDRFGQDDSVVGPESDAPLLSFNAYGSPQVTGQDGVDPAFQILALSNAVATDEDRLARGLSYRESDGEADAWGAIVVKESGGGGVTLTIPTIEWGHGLGSDPIVTRMTHNALDRLV